MDKSGQKIDTEGKRAMLRVSGFELRVASSKKKRGKRARHKVFPCAVRLAPFVALPRNAQLESRNIIFFFASPFTAHVSL